MDDSRTTPNNLPTRLPNGRLGDEYYQPFPPNYFAPKPGHQKLDIAIIGAGIAGLLTAVALAQSGHNVEVQPHMMVKDWRERPLTCLKIALRTFHICK